MTFPTSKTLCTEALFTGTSEFCTRFDRILQVAKYCVRS